MTILIVVILAIVSLWAFVKYENRRQETNQLRRAEQLVSQHAQELTVKRKQFTLKGSYGLVDTSKWEKEIVFFVANVVRPAVGEFRGQNLARVYQYMQLATAQYETLTLQLRPEMSGVDYEQLVADSLRSRGWETRLTKGSGDQGVDVIALKEGAKAVIQCKFYSEPVGNKAVQEALGGCAFENGNIAAVVTNAGFTSAARQLAASTGVLLLHHDELSRLDLFLPKGGTSVATSPPAEAMATFAVAQSQPSRGETDRPSATSVKVFSYFVAALAITGIVVGLMHSRASKSDAAATTSAQSPASAESVAPGRPAVAMRHAQRPPRHAQVQVPPAQITTTNAVDTVSPAPPVTDAGSVSTASELPASAGESAPGPTSTPAYQRCMQYLTSQGPEAKPGEYSAACSKEQ